MDDIIKKCSLEVEKMHVGYRNLRSIEVAEEAFADDVVPVSYTHLDVYKRQH